VEDQKRRHKVVSQKEKLLADIFRGRNDCKFLKEWQKKHKKQNLIILFLRSSKV